MASVSGIRWRRRSDLTTGRRPTSTWAPGQATFHEAARFSREERGRAVNGFRRFPEPAPTWVLAVLVAAYWALVWVGLHLLVVPPRLSAFWPAGGLALAGLLLVPGRQWPALLAGWFVVHAGAERFAGFPIVQALAYPVIALG